jgi:hypothetical protein
MTDKRKRQQLWGSMGGLTAWSRHGVETMLAPARRGFIARFERIVDPTGSLSQEERSRRAQRAMRAHMLQLAERSAKVRGADKKPTPAGRDSQAGPPEPVPHGASDRDSADMQHEGER